MSLQSLNPSGRSRLRETNIDHNVLLLLPIGQTMNSAHTVAIVDHAESIGFDRCGIVKAGKFPELEKMEEWLARGYAGEMKYLTNPRRADPRMVMADVRSIIVVLLNYNSALPHSIHSVARDRDEPPRGWISRYGWGNDYHLVLKEKLDGLVEFLKLRFDEPFNAQSYVDTGPVNERVMAKYAGLGWLGKNTLLLNQMLGSCFFLGVILTTLELEPTLEAGELPPPDLCGSCRRCLDACPTQAFPEPYVMDARRCISYLTIELRAAIPEEFREAMGNHVFGCDICQDVCPWNRRAPITEVQDFQPRIIEGTEDDSKQVIDQDNSHSLFRPELQWLIGISEQEFMRLFHDSPIKRTKWRGLIRSACIALGNSGLSPGSPHAREILPQLQALVGSEDQVVAESARWAISRIQ
jgi:epoxyqueuosine reductase